jgi:hypothetical protein
MPKTSLVSKPPAESNVGSNLPSLFTGSAAVGEYHGPTFALTPYVSFVDQRSPAFVKLSIHLRDLASGDPVLVLPDPQRPVKLSPMRFYLLQFFQHYSIVDSTGNITEMTRVAPEGPSDFKEHVESLILIANGETLTPARCTFKTTKVNAIHSAIAALEDAATPDWSGRSPEHRASLAIPHAWARFISTVKLKHATGKASGFAYVAASSTYSPAGPADWELLAKHLQDPAFIALSQATAKAFQDRISEVCSKEV